MVFEEADRKGIRHEERTFDFPGPLFSSFEVNMKIIYK